MELNEYQELALQTKQTQKKVGDSLIVSLLGLACEATGPLAEFKKFIRDGDSHKLYAERMREELGDIFWYLASAADEFDLTLEDVATSNLHKTKDRWNIGGEPSNANSYYDSNFPEEERIPRQFVIRFLSFNNSGENKVITYMGSQPMGQPLTDNAHHNDGYRFHDVFHLACAAVLGWSPVVRRNLGFKRRSNIRTDEVEDGGRAIVIEEAISAIVFDYAQSHDMLANVEAVDYELLRTVKTLAQHCEVRTKSLADWQSTILQAYSAWRELAVSGEGYIVCDLSNRRIQFTTNPEPSHIDVVSHQLPDVLDTPIEV